VKTIAAAAVLLLVAAPLPAQRGGRPGQTARLAPSSGSVGRIPFLDPGVVERRPVIPMRIGPIPLPPANIEWMRAETQHFVVISAVGEHGTRALAHDLEKLTTLLSGTSDYFQAPAQRTRVFLFASRRNVQPYFDAIRGGRVDASGITVRHPKGSTILIDTSARDGGTLTPRHEIVHDLLFRIGRPLPLWIEEGLAEYYSNAGLPIREHISRMRGRLRMPLEQMYSAGSDDARAWTFDYYAQSWATVATLMRRDPRAFFAFLRDIDDGVDTAAAISTHYRMTPRELEYAMRKVGTPALSVLLAAAPIEFEVKPIPRGELLSELGELLSRVRGREADAERHFRAALEAAPENAACHLAYAELLLAVPNRAVDARVQAQAALDADRAFETRANGIVGLSYLAANDAATARQYLERACEAAPENLDFTFPLFSIYVDAGERELADRIFDRIAETPRGNDARRRLLDSDVARADALAREGRLIEAAKILRDLAPKMPQKTRANLEGQAVRLESIAAGGRQ
jgi:tetratricopeptide (TPR) repeat protein